MVCNSDSYYWNFKNFKAIYGFVRVSLISWCCDCDTLDQFDTSTQTASDRDQVKISTLGKAQTGSFLMRFVVNQGGW